METVQTATREAEAFGREMLDLLKRQYQYFLDLERMAQEQRALIKAQQGEELLHLLSHRQKVVDAIGRVHKQSAPYREQWGLMKDRLGEELRTNIGSLLARLQQMLNGIIEQDQQDCRELSASKQLVASELNQTARARAANTYYGRPGANRPAGGGGNFQVTG